MASYEFGGAERGRSVALADGSLDEGWEHQLRLGEDVRFVLAAVGGGAIRIAGEIARRHVRHLETVAINCDPKVQSFDAFDRRVYLGPDSGADIDSGGSPIVGGLLARAAQPALERIFHGATFVILVGSLGGGAGSGAFPHVLEVASRNAEFVSAFVVRPFKCEGERRSLADRALARLDFVESFVDKKERGLATLRTLDNESLVHAFGHLGFSRVTAHWADVVEEHIETSFLAPAEAILDTARLAAAARAAPVYQVPEPAPVPGFTPPTPAPPPDLPPVLPAVLGAMDEAELTFEVEAEPRLPEAR